MTWAIDDPQGNESGKVKYEVVPYLRGEKVLDLGCGPSKAFPGMIGVDNCIDHQLFGASFKPDVEVETCAKLPYADNEIDAIFSSHLLEHIQDYRGALKEWRRVLKVGGNLVLYLPHKDLYPNVGTYGANPDHKHDFEPTKLIGDLCTLGGWDIHLNEVRGERNEYSFLLVLSKRKDWQSKHLYLKKKPEKTVCVVRFGGYGDMIQASGTLPELKRQGYHVTIMTTPKGQLILKDDPHVNGWFIQDTDQVPNGELGPHWKANARRYDKFINLSESVEVGLLFNPGTTKHGWPQAVRHLVANHNYGEFTAAIAEVPYKNEAKFYPTRAEVKAASKVIGGGFVIMAVLAGSSVHKFYPWLDPALRRVIAELPEAKIIMCGDEACKFLEQDWETEARVIRTSGQIGIRETMAVAQKCAVVVGPETGVLNAVAFEPNVKVCLLSHSSKENLTKHWINTTSLTGVASCYPCHQLHYSTEFCNIHPDTGAAMCQVTIDPDSVFEAIAAEYRAHQLRVA